MLLEWTWGKFPEDFVIHVRTARLDPQYSLALSCLLPVYTRSLCPTVLMLLECCTLSVGLFLLHLYPLLPQFLAWLIRPPGTRSRWSSLRTTARELPSPMLHTLEEKAGPLYYLCPQEPGPMRVCGTFKDPWYPVLASGQTPPKGKLNQ